MNFFRVPYFIQLMYWSKLWKGKDENCVYLTFDDGPDDTTTPWVLDLLKKEQIQATFFCLGNQMERHPSIFKYITDQGHAIGNHTYNHEKGNKTRSEDYLSSITKTDSMMNSELFRPPYGSITRAQVKKLKKLNKEIVMWSWISHDYNHEVDPKTIIKKAHSIRSRDILLFHNNKKSEKNLKDSLPQVIKIVKNKGLRFKTIID